MKFRKLLLTSLITVVSFITLVAQNFITVSGLVTDINGFGVEGVTINVSVFFADSSFAQATTITGIQGDYLVQLEAGDPNILGFVQVDMVDCNNTIQTQFFTTLNGINDFEANFTYCGNISTDSCEVFIIRESNPGMVDILTAWTPPNQTATYLWNTGETTQSIFPPKNGTYCVTVTLEPLGCTVSDCINFNMDSSFMCFAYIVTTQNNDGSYDLTAYSTGVAPYTYSWNTGDTGQTLVNVGPGTYCVIVTDSTGCFYSSCTIIQDNNFCEAYISQDPATGGLTAYGYGLPPVTYLWSTGETTQTIYPQVEGLYCVTVTDANNCVATSCYDYFQFDSCGVYVYAYMENDSTLALEAYPWGYGLTYSFQWNTGETGNIIHPTDPFQTYCVTVTDDTNCVSEGCYEPNNWCYAWLDLNYLDTSTAVITVNTDPIFNWPGTPPPTYLWSNGETTSSITVDSSGDYCVTVTLGTGCITEACTYVDFENLSTDCQAWVVQYPDSTNTEWYAYVYASGWGTFEYEWSTGDTTDIIQLDPNEFACVTVTSSLGCETVACVDTFFSPCQPYISVEYNSENEAILKAYASNDPNQSGVYTWSTGQTGNEIIVNTPGNYCVTFTGGGCTGTACVDVWFWTTCNVTIVTTDSMFGTLFTAIPSGVPPFSYLWDNGSTDQTILIDFGQLDHCVTVTDATGCVATACTYPFDSCYAYIYVDYTPDPVLNVVSNDWITFCQWNTGIGDTMLWLQVTEPGTYCATITTLNGCETTTCITLDSLNAPGIADVISGYVFADTLTTLRGTVHAYLIDNNTGGVFGEVGSSEIRQDGFYAISGLNPGIYLVKADFQANTEEDLLYIPTYHASATTWEEADPHVLPNLLTITTDIKLVRKIGHNGIGVIGGTVTDPNHLIASGETEEDRNLVGIGNVVILLYDETGTPIDYVKSDENGNFRFENLPFGTYRLKFDIPGIASPEVWVTLTQENPEKLQVNLIAENGSVGVHEPKSEVIDIYPNPAKEEINMTLPGGEAPYEIQIVDMQGRFMFSGSARNYNGILSIDVSRLSAGLYQVRLLNDGHRFHGRFLKQE